MPRRGARPENAPPLAGRSAAGPSLAAPRSVIDGLGGHHARDRHRLSPFLAPLCEAIGEDLNHGLAACRYAQSGDGRALCGTIR
ncbi:hypothetical protein [Streptomyces monashensis]|uniref:Uncharacterized protein n=1 Tax=Streptomyces monashensis TaxID=1678012 RepID=A0A1S2PGB0_9ACTN|nr:hypothetical protein [Streptomyces monashensis]OIJ92646.1 hypothetical protein BIV23_38530 [Streptomyces monashensis]